MIIYTNELSCFPSNIFCFTSQQIHKLYRWKINSMIFIADYFSLSLSFSALGSRLSTLDSGNTLERVWILCGNSWFYVILILFYTCILPFSFSNDIIFVKIYIYSITVLLLSTLQQCELLWKFPIYNDVRCLRSKRKSVWEITLNIGTNEKEEAKNIEYGVGRKWFYTRLTSINSILSVHSQTLSWKRVKIEEEKG